MPRTTARTAAGDLAYAVVRDVLGDQHVPAAVATFRLWGARWPGVAARCGDAARACVGLAALAAGITLLLASAFFLAACRCVRAAFTRALDLGVRLALSLRGRPEVGLRRGWASLCGRLERLRLGAGAALLGVGLVAMLAWEVVR